MESFGSFLDEEWESLSKLFSGDQDSGHFSGYGLSFETPSIVSSVMAESNIANASSVDNFCYYSYENVNPNSQETTNNGCFAYESSTLFPYPSSNITSLPNYNGGCDHDPIDFHEEMYNNSMLLSHVFSDDSMEEILCLRQNIENSVNLSVPDGDQIKRIPAKRKIDQVPIAEEEKPEEDLKKKTRVSRDNKNKKKVQPKKKQKVVDDKVDVKGVDGEDDNNNKVEGNAPIASSSSCGSEEDLNGGATNSNWKTRAGRGAATDPQSLYARKRRERINERLKILQNLVPNGTKVDISTMLEEAVQYVKFLQLQIKLLSSDEMWMYAPIAYNGMDMGLYNNLSQS